VIDMGSGPLIAVVGADGFVGGGFADGLNAKRIVYAASRNDEIHISQAESLLRKADVIINAGGFRVRRGLTYSDYRRCHAEANAVFIPWVRKDTLFIHMSSAHVLGKSKRERLGNDTEPNPSTYPSADYAVAKLEADREIEKAALERGFRAVFLRPTILYARPGDTSLPDNLCKWAMRGNVLRLYPRDARHHLCHLDILVEVVRRTIAQNDLPNLSRLVVADPYTITSRELEDMIVKNLARPARPIPIPSPLLSAPLRLLFHSRNPKYDLRTWGDIFGVFHLDTEYDPFETFRLLHIDPSQYSRNRTLEPFVRQALQ
jgi:nucleoside-diphosphate-sugar epimerase